MSRSYLAQLFTYVIVDIYFIINLELDITLAPGQKDENMELLRIKYDKMYETISQRWVAAAKSLPFDAKQFLARCSTMTVNVRLHNSASFIFLDMLNQKQNSINEKLNRLPSILDDIAQIEDCLSLSICREGISV